MPHLTMDELEHWIEDFEVATPPQPTSVWAVDASWDRTTIDTALIYVHLDVTNTEGYLRRNIGGGAEWHVTLLPFERDIMLSARQTQIFADEVASISKLCSYLTDRTAQHLARYRRR